MKGKWGFTREHGGEIGGERVDPAGEKEVCFAGMAIQQNAMEQPSDGTFVSVCVSLPCEYFGGKKFIVFKRWDWKDWWYQIIKAKYLLTAWTPNSFPKWLHMISLSELEKITDSRVLFRWEQEHPLVLAHSMSLVQFPDTSVGKEFACSAGNPGSIGCLRQPFPSLLPRPQFLKLPASYLMTPWVFF